MPHRLLKLTKKEKSDESSHRVSKDAPEQIFELCQMSKESASEPWEFIGRLPMFDSPRYDSMEIIQRTLHLGEKSRT